MPCCATDAIQIHLVELAKSRATAHNLSEMDPLEQWAFFLTNADRLSAAQMRSLLPAPVFGDAMDVLENIARDPKNWLQYVTQLRASMDKASEEYARTEGHRKALAQEMEKGLQQGREIGLEQGREIGLEQGREIGLEQGREQGLEQGELIGRIQQLQELLGDAPTMADDLAGCDKDRLAKTLAELRLRFDANRGM